MAHVLKKVRHMKNPRRSHTGTVEKENPKRLIHLRQW